MNAKVQTALLMKIGTNDAKLTKEDLCAVAFQMEILLNTEFPQCRVHIGAMEQMIKEQA